MRQPGIEPGSIAWKATMLTFTPPTLHGYLVNARFICRLPVGVATLFFLTDRYVAKHSFNSNNFTAVITEERGGGVNETLNDIMVCFFFLFELLKICYKCLIFFLYFCCLNYYILLRPSIMWYLYVFQIR